MPSSCVASAMVLVCSIHLEKIFLVTIFADLSWKKVVFRSCFMVQKCLAQSKLAYDSQIFIRNPKGAWNFFKNMNVAKVKDIFLFLPGRICFPGTEKTHIWLKEKT